MGLARPIDGGGDVRTAAFLEALADAGRAPVAADDVAVIVAHPDDETIGCGAQLARLVNVTVVIVTDGSPRGSVSVESHARTRSRELCAALALANVPQQRIIELGFSDQTAALQLLPLTRTLYLLMMARSINTVLTHAYEGGHPDHDATAFAVHAAAALMQRRGKRPGIVEMPLYRAEHGQFVAQRFVPAAEPPDRARSAEIGLDPSERALKQRMFAAHASQSAVLSSFGCTTERFRIAPRYNFRTLPNKGALLYEQHAWGMTGERWLALAESALAELGLANELSPMS